MVDEMQYEQALAGIEPTLQAVRYQREKQLQKWGVQAHSPEMWYAILGEEFGEVGKEIAEDRIKPFDRAAYRKECLHTAAVALAMVQVIDDGIA